MSKIISIGTAVPAYQHEQGRILSFMQKVYQLDAVEARKLKFLYRQSGIDYRYSAIADFSKDATDWNFFPAVGSADPIPSIEKRMNLYGATAAPMAKEAIEKCLAGQMACDSITHLITVSCTGMSAPGLDLELIELLNLPKNIYRSSINFMGCYAAIHALKLAHAICQSESNARVMIVCTELCTLHFQNLASADNIASSLLFGDGAAAVLVVSDDVEMKGLYLKSFYSEIVPKGKDDMSWVIASTGFLMTLSGYVPDLIQADFDNLMNKALNKAGITKEDIQYWCIHPGGKRILDAIAKSLDFKAAELDQSLSVLKEYGNMSSPTVLFVLKKIMEQLQAGESANIFGAAFGPGLTMETFIVSTHA
ncbi:type III polyketide synthase [Sediminibacterium sp.]|uniref:type III polyketide synthase n=1 Tax=Sediminibacterium sp. TaxID=1917865 RepID=UPI0027315B77|nr:type III polyketide synthase [Sediminibacterium sp.]MDP2422575.1 type III polyketide synthase [Sediminibacterium sp.]